MNNSQLRIVMESSFFILRIVSIIRLMQRSCGCGNDLDVARVKRHMQQVMIHKSKRINHQCILIISIQSHSSHRAAASSDVLLPIAPSAIRSPVHHTLATDPSPHCLTTLPKWPGTTLVSWKPACALWKIEPWKQSSKCRQRRLTVS